MAFFSWLQLGPGGGGGGRGVLTSPPPAGGQIARFVSVVRFSGSAWSVPNTRLSTSFLLSAEMQTMPSYCPISVRALRTYALRPVGMAALLPVMFLNSGGLMSISFLALG